MDDDIDSHRVLMASFFHGLTAAALSWGLSPSETDREAPLVHLLLQVFLDLASTSWVTQSDFIRQNALKFTVYQHYLAYWATHSCWIVPSCKLLIRAEKILATVAKVMWAYSSFQPFCSERHSCPYISSSPGVESNHYICARLENCTKLPWRTQRQFRKDFIRTQQSQTGMLLRLANFELPCLEIY